MQSQGSEIMRINHEAFLVAVHGAEGVYSFDSA